MKPAFRVTSSGNDITQQIADRLLSIRVQDEAGQKSDTLEITLDDRGQELPLPEQKVQLKVALGYSGAGQSLQEMGTYVIDEVEITHPPATVKIRAKAMELSGKFKEQKSRSWHDKTVGQIVSQIAREHGLTPMVHSRYTSRKVDHIDQTAESDAHFLTRLAKLFGATSKPAEGRLVFIPTGEGISSSGRALTPATLDRSQVKDYRATIKDRGAYTHVVAKYTDKATGTEKSLEVPVPNSSVGGVSFLESLFGIGSGGSSKGAKYQDRKLYPSRAEAQEAARSKGKSLASGTVTIDLTCAGRPDIFAERPITLTGFRDPLNSTWIIQSVTHELSSGGYTTKITCGTSGREGESTGSSR
jgi:phage protein D